MFFYSFLFHLQANILKFRETTLSHERQLLVSLNFRILVSILQKQAFWNLRRQEIVSRATIPVSPNFKMLVFVISKQVFWNLGRQAVVSRATVLSPQISECLFLQFRSKYSEIWGDRLLSPVRHCCLPKF